MSRQCIKMNLECDPVIYDLGGNLQHDTFMSTVQANYPYKGDVTKFGSGKQQQGSCRSNGSLLVVNRTFGPQHDKHGDNENFAILTVTKWM